MSVAELLILATVLDVAPAVLISALGESESVEIAPGQIVSAFRAHRWIASGQHWGDDADLEDSPEAVRLRRVLAAGEAAEAYADLLTERLTTEAKDLPALDARLATAREGLSVLRELVRAYGRTPPQLPEIARGLDEDGPA